MGKKSTNSTKSGKFMNPTDRTRKEARKKELKKNKKQRAVVRAAVIKGKDPYQILADLERLDQMEYNVNEPPSLNEKVMLEKRRKLMETWERVLRLYIKEEKDKYLELKRLQGEQEAKRNEMRKFYQAVMSTKSVDLEEIPLPDIPSAQDTSCSDIPTPILRKTNLVAARTNFDKTPPGPPPGPPPVLDDLITEDIDEPKKRKGVSFVEEPKEADVNEFLKEIEFVSVQKPPPSLPTATAYPQIQAEFAQPPKIMVRPNIAPPMNLPHMPPIMPPHPHGGAAIPPPMNYHGQQHPRMNMNMPQMLPPRPIIQPSEQSFASESTSTKIGATIEAKPQLRNLSADATRFTPVSLRVKRNDKQTKKSDSHLHPRKNEAASSSKPATGDAYDAFMKEMEEFM
ncbi:WW domain-binding protein 11 [Halotydeus destructor]|nr:WW domain-binding protein 11 [Halotydeus destructor]